MNRIRLSLLMVIVLSTPAGAAPPPRFSPGQVLVVSDDPPSVERGTPAAFARSDRALGGVLEQAGLSRFERIGRGPLSRNGRTRGYYRLSSDRPDFDPLATAERLRATGRLRAVCPNYRLRLLNTIPNDPYLDVQWHVSKAAAGAVHLPQAWDTQRGSSSVLMCFFDVGIDIGHPDLAGKIWVNPGEIPGNSVDDDNNGYVDDVQGWDFGDGDNDPSPTPLFEQAPLPFDEDSIDVAYHGTFAAGLAAAATDNGEGIAGVDWNARILAIKISDSNGLIYTDRFTEAMQYAVDQGVKVMSISLGADGPGIREFFQSLVDIAVAGDAVVVASAGNDGTNQPVYPAACDSVLAVASIDSDNQRSSSSNYGAWVDIAAPGDAMFSCIHRNYEIDFVSQLYYYLLFGWDLLNPYMYGSGTSFAAPIVAGACALVRAQHPGLNERQVSLHIIESADSVGLDQTIGSAGHENRKLNVQSAVGSVVAVEPGPPNRHSVAAWPNPSRTNTSIAFSLAAPGPVRVTVVDLLGRVVRRIADGPFAAGNHVLLWPGTDDGGGQMAAGVYHVLVETGEYRRSLRIARVR